MKADAPSPLIMEYGSTFAHASGTDNDHSSNAEARPSLFKKLQVNML